MLGPIQRLLVAHRLVLLRQGVVDLLLLPGIDLVDRGVEPPDQGAGDLPLPLVEQRGQQDERDRLVVAFEVAGRFDGRGRAMPIRPAADSSEQGAGSPTARTASSLSISRWMVARLTDPGLDLIRVSRSVFAVGGVPWSAVDGSSCSSSRPRGPGPGSPLSPGGQAVCWRI
jgi:hypothetical protein